MSELVLEGKRQMQICNSCRYCEGYCAVWHAIEHRREFTDKDMMYLSNLCHDCRECFFACPFATPHEFGINPPKLFAGLREETYKKYSFASPLTKANFWVVTVVAFVLFLVIATVADGSHSLFSRHLGTGSFYQILSLSFLTICFCLLGLWMLLGWVIGASRYWQDIKSSTSERVIFDDVKSAIKYGTTLRFLGKESTEEEVPASRRWFHHFVFYGFILDLASTILGAIYTHVLHIEAPYPILSPVVLLGILGGIGIIIGASGLLYLKSGLKPSATDEKASKSGRAFSISLLAIAGTGMLLLILRDSSFMGIMLMIHLSTVASLFFTAPYGKFIHFVYRFMALVRHSQEERTSGH